MPSWRDDAATAASGSRAGSHYADAEHEYAHDRHPRADTLGKAWDEGAKRGGTIVDMKTDWTAVFPSRR
jgi:hypothetical protein